MNFPKGVDSWRFNFFRIDPSIIKNKLVQNSSTIHRLHLAFMGKINLNHWENLTQKFQ